MRLPVLSLELRGAPVQVGRPFVQGGFPLMPELILGRRGPTGLVTGDERAPLRMFGALHGLALALGGMRCVRCVVHCSMIPPGLGCQAPHIGVTHA